MKAKLIIDGKELEININHPELEKLINTSTKKTGYERVKYGEHFYIPLNDDGVLDTVDMQLNTDDVIYDIGNYYSDKTVAENNARADKLMRQLRRFAVEHRENDLRWDDAEQLKHYIVFDCGMSLGVHHCSSTRELNVVYFDSIAVATSAIKTFHDELIWYFTEYKDSL